MPGLNKTGPKGQGPMTGRRMGRCKNNGPILKNQTNAESEDSNKTNVENMTERGLGLGRCTGGHRRGQGTRQQNRFRGGF
ncbi:MAG: DUF5320 domain-containing protein [Bacteroidota bacterium]